MSPSSDTVGGGGGGGRDERSELRLKRSGESGSTNAGWRRRREALKPSQAAASPSAALVCGTERVSKHLTSTNPGEKCKMKIK